MNSQNLIEMLGFFRRDESSIKGMAKTLSKKASYSGRIIGWSVAETNKENAEVDRKSQIDDPFYTDDSPNLFKNPQEWS